jgi:2-polyprenyl-3-methyl-5-hydroxy-6-metoxy-1,4-benzoquinol methylase
VNATLAVGIDVVPENVAAARSRGVHGVLGNLDRGFPLLAESVDMVVASHVIEHVSDTDTLVQECYRVLKPGGHIIMATPNLAAFTNIAFLILGKQPTIAEVSDVALVGTWSPRGSHVDRAGPAHRRIFTRGALTGLLDHYGFQCEKVVGSGFLPLPEPLAGAASRLLPRYASNITVRARKP